MDPSFKVLATYVNAASDLADAIKKDIMKNDSKISDQTILKLNAFIIATNGVQYLLDPVIKTNKLN